MSEKRISVQKRRIVIERAQGCCEYCVSQEDFATQSFSVEHIHPKSRGGDDSLANLAFACQGCNGHKHTKIEAPDPVSREMVTLFNPRKQQWQTHFYWSEDYTHIIGLTPTGRATVEALKLNRGNLLNLRRVLYELGEHPPKHHREDE